jgi:hypothetical protein
MTRSSLILAAALLVAGAANAQPMMDPPELRGGPGRPGMPHPAAEEWAADSCDSTCQPMRMGKERRMLEAVRISRMTEALDLSEEQIAKFFPRLRKTEETMRAFDKQRDQLTADLEKLLSDNPRDGDLKAKLDQIDKLEEQKLRRLLADRGDLDGILSVPQRAKLRVFNQRFEDEVRSMVRTIRERRMKHFRP